MDTGNTTVGELREELKHSGGHAWVRLLLGPQSESGSPLRFGKILVGPRPAGWAHRRWTYGDWTFTTAEMTARRVAALLVAGEPQSSQVDGLAFSYSLQENVQWFRLASHQEYSSTELPWPSRLAMLSLLDNQQNAPGGYIVGAGPSFPTFAGAYNAFFYDQWIQSGANQGVFGQISLSIVDGRARIRRVVARAASLDVWVEGRGLKSCRLELNSATDRLEVETTRSGKLTLPLPSGLGRDAWLWLKDEGGWLDNRSLRPWGGRQSRNVEFEAPEDPVAEVTALASQGESTYLEYKRELPEDNPESKRKCLKTVVAFANGDGGTILFGVDGDDNAGTVVGLAGKPAELLRRLNGLIRDRVTPTPTFSIRGHVVDSKYVIKLDVSSGGGILYALILDANRPEYHVRRNGSTYFARPEELAQVVAKATAQPNQGLLDLLK